MHQIQLPYSTASHNAVTGFSKNVCVQSIKISPDSKNQYSNIMINKVM